MAEHEQTDNEIVEYTEALRANPTVEARLNLGRAYMRNGDYHKANSHIGVACYDSIHPDRRSDTDDEIPSFLRRQYQILLCNRGDFYKYDDVIADCTEAIRKNPDDAEAYLYRGYAYDMKGGGDNAVADYESVLRIKPTHAEARQKLEKVKEMLGREIEVPKTQKTERGGNI